MRIVSGGGVTVGIGPRGGGQVVDVASIDVRLRDGVTGADITRSISDDAVTTNQLIHVAVTRENVGTSTIMKVFHNGVEVSYQAGEQDRDFNNGSSVIGTKANAQNFYIGQFSTNIQRYAGEIARMKFWVNTAGTPAEISEEFNSEQALLMVGLAYFPTSSTLS